jgi:ABC-type lipoprotein release transport system permease subunit
MALGAARRDIARLVLGDGLKLAGIGTIIGIAAVTRAACR